MRPAFPEISKKPGKGVTEMGIWYATSKPITMAELFDGRLQKHGIREYTADEIDEKYGSPKLPRYEHDRCLIDADGNTVPVLGPSPIDIKVVEGVLGGSNRPERIYQAICDEFGVKLSYADKDNYGSGFRYQPKKQQRTRSKIKEPTVRPQAGAGLGRVRGSDQ
jgi:hypothetical protein